MYFINNKKAVRDVIIVSLLLLSLINYKQIDARH